MVLSSVTKVLKIITEEENPFLSSNFSWLQIPVAALIYVRVHESLKNTVN